MDNHSDTIQQKEIQLSPSTILVLSKQSAQTFHNQVKSLIYESGNGLFEYLETIAFFSKIGEVIRGKDTMPADKEFIDYVRQEIAKYEGGKFVTARGVKFEVAEVGTRYDFTTCGDPVILELYAQLETIKSKIAAREAFLRTVPKEGQTIVVDGSAEVVTVYQPQKKSTSSYKTSLAR